MLYVAVVAVFHRPSVVLLFPPLTRTSFFEIVHLLGQPQATPLWSGWKALCYRRQCLPSRQPSSLPRESCRTPTTRKHLGESAPLLSVFVVSLLPFSLLRAATAVIGSRTPLSSRMVRPSFNMSSTTREANLYKSWPALHGYICSAF